MCGVGMGLYLHQKVKMRPLRLNKLNQMVLPLADRMHAVALASCDPRVIQARLVLYDKYGEIEVGSQYAIPDCHFCPIKAADAIMEQLNNPQLPY